MGVKLSFKRGLCYTARSFSFFDHICLSCHFVDMARLFKKAVSLDSQYSQISSLRFSVLVPTAGLFVVLLALMGLDPLLFVQILQATQNTTLSVFGYAYTFFASVTVCFCIWLCLGPLAQLKIGGESAQPTLSVASWFVLSLCTTIAVGILFWGGAEPLLHQVYPRAGLGIEPNSQLSKMFGISTALHHWTFVPYSIYTATTILFALAVYNDKYPFELSSLVRLPKTPSLSWLQVLIEVMCLLTLIAGMSANLGVGILLISGALGHFGWVNPSDPYLYAGLVACLSLVIWASSASGVHAGMKLLSWLNSILMAVFMLVVVILAPKLGQFELALDGWSHFLQRFPSLMLSDLKFVAHDEWVREWKAFYWSNWYAWAPMTGLFLARLCYGRTIRQVICCNLIAPALVCGVWVSFFGSLAVSFAANKDDILLNALSKERPENVTFLLLERLWGGDFLIGVFILLVALCFVTAADSNTDTMSRLVVRVSADQKETAGEASLIYKVKFLWTVLVGGLSCVFLVSSGLDGVKLLSQLGGIPAVVLINIGIFRLLFSSSGLPRRSIKKRA